MPDRPLRILQVGSTDVSGGAALVAGNLQRGYRSRGCASWLAVGRKVGIDRDVLALPDDDRAVYLASGYRTVRRGLDRVASRFPGRGWGQINRSLRLVTHPRALLDSLAGREDFEFPATSRLLELAPELPDIVHCHNLHGGYFDLRALVAISQRVPTVLTLHDEWLLSGHCAHSFECDRWKTGCGECPDLTIDPPIRRDATAENWTRKREIFARSRLYVATPSQWLLDRVRQSMLAPAVRDARVIPNGIDTAVFQPAPDRLAVRRELGVSADALMILVVAVGQSGQWRDHEMLRATAELIAERAGSSADGAVFKNVTFVVVGGGTTPLGLGRTSLRCIPYETDARAMARYYQAADVYLHLARADTFPNTILEALACGTPVVATAVGGIPEQIRQADIAAIRSGAIDCVRNATGATVSPGDARAAADAIEALVVPDAARVLRRNAASDARARFDMNQQIECYLDWYGAIIDNWNHGAFASP